MSGLNIAETTYKITREVCTDFVRMTVRNMNFWLCRFVAKARHVDGLL